MSLATLQIALPARKLPIWGAYMVLAIVITASAHAKPARGKKVPTVQPLPPPAMDRNSSRFVSLENQKEYLDKMLPRISMTTRAADPFGRSQDPNAAAESITSNDPTKPRAVQQQKVPLKQIVALLKISTVIPREKRFLLDGGASFRVGETVPLTYRGKTIQAQVVSLNSSQISFRDSVSGDTATLEMQLLPPGFQPGVGAPGAPGLFRNDKKAPIILDAP